MNDRSRAIVVGNGCIGASIFVELHRRRHSIIRLRKQHRPFTESSAAESISGSFSEVKRHTLRTDSGRLTQELNIQQKRIMPGEF